MRDAATAHLHWCDLAVPSASGSDLLAGRCHRATIVEPLPEISTRRARAVDNSTSLHIHQEPIETASWIEGASRDPGQAAAGKLDKAMKWKRLCPYRTTETTGA